MVKTPFRPWKILVISGSLFLLAGLFLLGRIFVPVVSQEIDYAVRHSKFSRSDSPSATLAEIIPPNPDFSLYIPKIGALVPVVADVDPYDSQIYQRQLTRGVAHAKGSAYPDQDGNTFLFAHSAGNPLEASRYNGVFFLLSKLEPGDEIIVWYLGTKKTYLVAEKQTVTPTEVSYLSKASATPTLTLMTCWPPGTTLKRLLVIAHPGSL